MKIILLFPLCSLIWSQVEVGSENTLDIMTWNLEWFPKHDDTDDYVDSLIRPSHLDIIALQEITSTPAFNQLIDIMNDSDSLNQWIGFRAANGEYMELAYIINTSSITIINTPYSILNEYGHYFAYRTPYVIKVSYMNNEFIIINNHYKCCGDGIIQNDYWDEEYRRQQASIYLKNYIDTYLSDENVIVLGDLNDELTDSEANNVFWNFLSDPDEYMFVDMEIAQGSPESWSYPTWPSHIDHILVTNELIDNIGSVNTVLYDEELTDGWLEYEHFISDHRSVYISLCMDEDAECGICGEADPPEYGTCCQLLGDMNGDAYWHVDDIVLLVNCILVEECDTLDNGCAGDINGDEEWHVDDIVLLVNCILSETCPEDLGY